MTFEILESSVREFSLCELLRDYSRECTDRFVSLHNFMASYAKYAHKMRENERMRSAFSAELQRARRKVPGARVRQLSLVPKSCRPSTNDKQDDARNRLKFVRLHAPDQRSHQGFRPEDRCDLQSQLGLPVETPFRQMPAKDDPIRLILFVIVVLIVIGLLVNLTFLLGNYGIRPR
jgi:hypothetical protein